MVMGNLFFGLHFAASWGMVAIIWFVQINQYPLLRLIDLNNLKKFETANIKKTERVVIPFMLIELLTGVILLFKLSYLFYFAFLILLTVWIYTFVAIVPLHMKLKTTPDQTIVDRLVKKNWVRTVLWTLKGFVVLYLYLS